MGELKNAPKDFTDEQDNTENSICAHLCDLWATTPDKLHAHPVSVIIIAFFFAQFPATGSWQQTIIQTSNRAKLSIPQ